MKNNTKIGYADISLNLPTDYSDDQIEKRIRSKLKIKEFSWQIERKSLDARKKNNIRWQIRASVFSKELKVPLPPTPPPLGIPHRKRSEKAVVVGSGPAGFFSAFILQKAGFNTTLIERGSGIAKRAQGISDFESTGIFNPVNNYAFGEGGAGTFSDGKLTSRSKHIARERQFILSSYIAAGAPGEIAYMSHPHLGTDNLRIIVHKLREEFLKSGGQILFETLVEDLSIVKGTVHEAITTSGAIKADIFIIAPGHSAYDTLRMLIKRGIQFRTKNFAVGARVEHPQELINKAQWGRKTLPGVKAAEYRLSAKGKDSLPVYTFCMCPGGTIVPAAAYGNLNIVNGLSQYKRSDKFANAACVAGINLDKLTGNETTPPEALNWLEALEKRFYQYSNGYQAPFCRIEDFINRKESSELIESSYPLGLKPAPLWDLLPAKISAALSFGLKDFSKKLKGFETGAIIGLESKTSSPIQALREENGLCPGFSNLYIAGEGSGYSGGIISSGADGIKAALKIAANT